MNIQFIKHGFLRGALLLMIPFISVLNVKAQSVHHSRVNIGLAYPFSSNGNHAAADTNLFSFNLIAGVSAAEEGFSFAGISSVIKNYAKGVQFAGFSNHIGQYAEGFMFAGFMNTYGKAKGMQFAGFTNIALKDVEGAQFAGFMNKAANLDGAQIAGFSNVAKEVTGSQVAGFSNISGDIKGSQFAGFTNTAGDVEGSQFAGFINIAKKVKGLQLAGFVNIADSSDHPIGVLNLIKDGEKSIGFSMDETQTGLVSFRSGGRVLYGIMAAGYNFKNNEDVYAFELGLGAHILNSPVFRINTEVSTLMLESFHSGEYFKSSFRFMPALRPVKGIEIFGGPVFNYVNTNTIEGKALNKHYLHTWESRWRNNFEGIYIGYQAGIHFLFK